MRHVAISSWLLFKARANSVAPSSFSRFKSAAPYSMRYLACPFSEASVHAVSHILCFINQSLHPN